MIRVIAIVEGPTEEQFFKNIIQPHLIKENIDIRPCLTGYKRRVGGNIKYARVKDHIIRALKEDRNRICTTFYDFYGLFNDFPGIEEAKRQNSNSEKLLLLQKYILQDVSSDMGKSFDQNRFIPYFQMYEFEALLFSDCENLAFSLGKSEIKDHLQNIRDQFETPEEINDDSETSPSHRILNLHETYNKILDSSISVKNIGLEKIRLECPLFNQWLSGIESLGD